MQTSSESILREAGYTYPEERASALELMWRYDHHRLVAKNPAPMTRDDILMGVEMFPNIVDGYAEIADDGIFNPAMACWLKQCFLEAAPEASDEFCERMFLGTAESAWDQVDWDQTDFARDPVEELRDLLGKGESGQDKELANDVAAAVIRLWNAEYLNEPVNLHSVLKADGVPSIAGRRPQPWAIKGVALLA